MLKLLLSQSRKSKIASILLLIFVFQLLYPINLFALTSGPSQPEMQSFEPVGTTDLVDHFSGNFNYNIPLLDVEGYPINIAYHSGVTMEQEASWVGLGWNINPGNINHMMRGLPDDFKGETIEKTVTQKDEVRKNFGTTIGAELLGGTLKGLGASLNFGMSFSNYSGISADFSYNLSYSPTLKKYNKGKSWISGGANMGFKASTSDGASFDPGLSLSYGSQMARNHTGTVTGSFGRGYNSRQGLMYTSFGVSGQLTKYKPNKPQDKKNKIRSIGNNDFNFSSTPVSLSNYVPVITNAASMFGFSYQTKGGSEAYGVYLHGGLSVGVDVTNFESNGNRRGYGYMYLQDGSHEDMMDFTRDKDGRYYRGLQVLPAGNMAYDVYSVNGQGTGGSFRPFRDDIGPVFDPSISSTNNGLSAKLEVGAGNLFEVGVDLRFSNTSSKSGPWKDRIGNRKFLSKVKNELFEPVYFKQSGELSGTNEPFKTAIGSDFLPNYNLLNGYNQQQRQSRAPRANLVYCFTAEEASNPNISLMPKLQTYTNTTDILSSPTEFDRYNKVGYRKKHQISEIVQINTDGQRYVYGIPAMNIEQREYVHSVDVSGLYQSNVNPVPSVVTGKNPLTSETVNNQNNSNLVHMNHGYHMKTKTPAYAHSYLLTSVLSPDYSDITGNGITEDDLGSYTKFNYTLYSVKNNWRTPYSAGSTNLDIGVRSDCHDDKGSVVCGTKENWMLHSIESKNFIARFYTSPRVDGYSAVDPVLFNTTDGAPSYKLDKIVLYSKHDLNKPIKEIIFTYDYTLCKGVLNMAPGTSITNGGPGKLTLKAIAIRNGSSDIGLLSPYQFIYGGLNPDYDESCKDVWGEYKSNNPTNGINMTNKEFPYVDQMRNESTRDAEATAWNLTKVKLPSGGEINVTYEQDDYAYVQDKRAMEMIKVEGCGQGERFSESSNLLYLGKSASNQYLYFKRRATELYPNDIPKSYFGAGELQYNFEVNINNERTESCNIPLQDNVKGYAEIDASGICTDDPTYAWVRIKHKSIDRNNLGTGDLECNPISIAAMQYGQYYNNKAINPSSDIVNPNPVSIIKGLASAIREYKNYVQNPIIGLINRDFAKTFNIGRSFIRINSQHRKFGGGHRVKQLEYNDQSISGTTASTNDHYGFTYEYTTNENGVEISSGVASYEPLIGGDENPNRNLRRVDKIGQSRKFPMVMPMEAIVENPLGETIFPPGSVGYRKVTVKSINLGQGVSSNVYQTHEFYTAKDFPIIVKNSPLDEIESVLPNDNRFDFINKDILKVGQNYTIVFNDMHGKPMANRTFVQTGSGSQETAHTYFEYHQKKDPETNTMQLDNVVNCYPTSNLSADINIYVPKELGVESDITYDIREKQEKTRNYGADINLNTFIVGILPFPIPLVIPSLPKGQDKNFSTVVATKVVQKYGIIKSVETFDKGAKVKQVNDAYDELTGQVLLSHISTEHDDNEYTLKTPAYYAYTGMGPAYQNILYEEDIEKYQDNRHVSIIDDVCYIYTDHPERYNLGDELTFQIGKSCVSANNEGEEYKLWVVDKTSAGGNKSPNLPDQYRHICEPVYCPNSSSEFLTKPGSPFNYLKTRFCDAPADYDTENKCVDELYMKKLLEYYGIEKDISNITWTQHHPLEAVEEFLSPTSCAYSNTLTPINCQNGNSVTISSSQCGHHYSSTRVQRYKAYKNTGWTSSIPTNAMGFNSRDEVLNSSHLLVIEYKWFVKPTFYLRNQGPIVPSDHMQGNSMSENNRMIFFNTPGYDNLAVDNFEFGQTILNNYLPNHTLILDPPSFLYTTIKVYLPVDPNSSLTSQWLSALNTPYGFSKIGYKATAFEYTPGLQCVDNNLMQPISQVEVQRIGARMIKRVDAFKSYNNLTAIACKPLKRGALPASGNTAKAWPSYDSITAGSVKVIRSGKRNMLNTDVQQITALTQPKHIGYTDKVLMNGATEYTDNGVLPNELNPHSIYFNSYVTGGKGTYRPVRSMVYQSDRHYGSSFDRQKGHLAVSSTSTNVPSFWENITGQSDLNTYYRLQPPLNPNSNKWYAKSNVVQYNPWGNDIEVKDASGNIHCNLFGYGNKLPIAVVSNAKSKHTFFDNFEDYQNPASFNTYINNTQQPTTFGFNYNHNPIRASELGITTSNNNLEITGVHHSGLYGLKATATATIPISFSDFTGSDQWLTPFIMNNSKFVFSYWQKVSGISPPPYGGLKFQVNSTYRTATPKTPIIDGWVMYEGIIDLSTFGGTTPAIQIEFGANTTLDDIRVMPYQSNMKSYVYRPDNFKLVAVLDENHMSTFFEYSPEGKLIRIKKETEKGILTLKESRESLRNAFITLTQPNIGLPFNFPQGLLYTPVQGGFNWADQTINY